jgi:hypothetical protein
MFDTRTVPPSHDTRQAGTGGERQRSSGEGVGPFHEVARDHHALDLSRAVHHLEHLREVDEPRERVSWSQP